MNIDLIPTLIDQYQETFEGEVRPGACWITNGTRDGAVLGIWADRGAVGDTAWRDAATGQLMTRDVDIPMDTLRRTAKELLAECGQIIRLLAAGLSMPDWP